MSDYLDKIQTQKKDGTPLATVPFRDSAAREDITTIQNELTIDTTTIEGNPLNFTTLSAQTAKSTILSVEPIQDLHGYDKPWVGGAGKNKLPMTVDGIKSENTNGSWSGNVYTFNNVTFTILTDSDGNVTGIKATGTANASTFLAIPISDFVTKYVEQSVKVNGVNDTSNSARIWIGGASYRDVVSIATGEREFTVPSDMSRFWCQIYNGATVTNVIFYPMIRLSTETDPTFAPYTNICPITGRTEIGILGWGKNLFGYGKNTVDATTTYRTNSAQRLILVESANPNSVKLRYNNGSWSRAYFQIDGIDGTQDYVISYTVAEKTVSYTPVVSKDTENSDSTKLVIIVSGGNNANVSSSDYIVLSNIQVEKGLTATDYTPYQESNDLTISLGQTVYGGTLDVEKGQLSILYKTKSGKIGGVNTNYSNLDYGMVGKADDSADKGNYDYHDTISSMFAFENASGDWNNANKIGKAYMGANLAYYWFGFPKGTTLEDMQTITNDNVICYELATPITIQLTPHTIKLLEGVNNISTDGDKITLTYRDGSVATLGDLTSAVDNLDSKIDQSKILTDTVTGDKYILVVTNGVLSVEQVSN